MEALGSASSIIAVIQLTGSVAKLCGGYIEDVKDARRDIERLLQKTATLCDALERLAQMADQTKARPLSLPAQVTNSLHQCQQHRD
jgi:hypothetical protein